MFPILASKKCIIIIYIFSHIIVSHCHIEYHHITITSWALANASGTFFYYNAFYSLINDYFRLRLRIRDEYNDDNEERPPPQPIPRWTRQGWQGRDSDEGLSVQYGTGLHWLYRQQPTSLLFVSHSAILSQIGIWSKWWEMSFGHCRYLHIIMCANSSSAVGYKKSF